MRTPNTECCICGKPLYRRPGELSRRMFVSCKACFGEAERKFGDGFYLKTLGLGREKGTNHLSGIPKSAESNIKRSVSHKRYWAEHPEEAIARGLKIRGKNSGQWKGGITGLHQAIRTSSKNKKWASKVIARDGCKCSECGGSNRIEAHHIVGFSYLIEKNEIRSLDDAYNTPAFWDIDNGIALCRRCHCEAHGIVYNDN